DRELAVVDLQLRLQMSHVVRQLASILRSVVTARKDHDDGGAGHQAGQLRRLSVLVGKLDIRESFARPEILSHGMPPLFFVAAVKESMQILSMPPRLEQILILQVRRTAAARIDTEQTAFAYWPNAHVQRRRPAEQRAATNP